MYLTQTVLILLLISCLAYGKETNQMTKMCKFDFRLVYENHDNIQNFLNNYIPGLCTHFIIDHMDALFNPILFKNFTTTMKRSIDSKIKFILHIMRKYSYKGGENRNTAEYVTKIIDWNNTNKNLTVNDDNYYKFLFKYVRDNSIDGLLVGIRSAGELIKMLKNKIKEEVGYVDDEAPNLKKDELLLIVELEQNLLIPYAYDKWQYEIKHFDYIIVQRYIVDLDYHLAYGDKPVMFYRMYVEHTINYKKIVNHLEDWNRDNLPTNKIIIEFSTDVRRFNKNSKIDPIYEPSNKYEMAKFKQEQVPYNEICININKGDVHVDRANEYIYFDDDDYFYFYNNIYGMASNAYLIKDIVNLGGVAINGINSDDYLGKCIPTIRFPLTRTLVCGVDESIRNSDLCSLPSNFSEILESLSKDYDLPSPFENGSFSDYKGDEIKQKIIRKSKDNKMLWYIGIAIILILLIMVLAMIFIM
uniref:Uncharacterized protein n=1 Tax=Acrobeloides nanus TaxID=290746 RepID=A0A914DSD4_9BILA